MPVEAFQANQGTQTNILIDNTGGTAGTVIPVMKIAMDGQGTYTDANLFQGTLKQINNIGTIPNIPGGTINAATISALPNTPGGTINLATVTGNLGTIGTIGLATVSGNLGTIGTIGLATITGNSPMPSGTLNVGTINTATITAGSLVVTAATIAAGTFNLGTVRQDARTTQNILSFGTQVGMSAGTQATIIGSTSVGAGTSLWLQDVSITNSLSGLATVILGFGTTQQGTNVLLRQTLGTNGAVGIEKTFAKAVNAGMTNQDLVLGMTGAGTIDMTISYFISA